MFTYPFSNEIGAGEIPKEVQDAIWREIHFRLGNDEEPSPLSRLEKSLVLIRINAGILNSMRTYLHMLEALKAGGTLDQVTEAAISVTTIGMLRWKMAALDALSAADAWAQQNNLQPRTPPTLEKEIKEYVEEMRKHIQKALSREFPYMFERLLEVAPSVLYGFMRMRMTTVRSDGAIPKHIKELMIVGSDTAQRNSWGAEIHANQAIRDGATLGQVTDTIALTMLEIGQSAYRTGGMDALKGAKEALAEVKTN
jgi:alkylhydroperoxidase/carboxymuconolactone decarboxylase family protein YurZ